MSAFVAGLGLLALIGIFLFSADRDFTGFRAADTAAVAQTPAATIQRVEDYIPAPVYADVPPLTLADLAREGGDKWIASQVPTPEPAGVAPITLRMSDRYRGERARSCAARDRGKARDRADRQGSRQRHRSRPRSRRPKR